MSDAEGLTARFKEISSQLDLIVSETEEAINSDITKVNILSEQLANINKQLAATEYCLDSQCNCLMNEIRF